MLNQEFSRFGGGGETFLTPLGLLALVVASVLILVLPRKYIVIALLAGSLLVPSAQVVVLCGLHFMGVRILIMVGWMRIVCQGLKAGRIRLTSIDKTMILWAVSGVVTFTVLWGSVQAFVNRMGLLYTALGVYFLMRCLHQNEDALYRTIKALSFICVVLCASMVREHFVGANSFYAISGVNGLSEVREGLVRAQGPFAHAILAGCFGAVLVPLFAGLWWRRKARSIALVGMLSATAITIMSVSSTAMIAYLAGMGALLMWPCRRHMRLLRWGMLVMLVGLHLVMKAPVWAVISHIHLLGQSSSYQRSELVNQTITHFWDWWLWGQKTTYQWGYNMWDTANTYVETATTGGLATLVLLLAIIVYCFKGLGTAIKASKDSAGAKMLWSMGAALFANVVAFLGITYYDQTVVVWYTLLALICSATYPLGRPVGHCVCSAPGDSLAPETEQLQSLC